MVFMGDVYSIWLREMIRYVRARSRVVTSLITPLLWLIIFGSGFSSSLSFGGAGGTTNYINFLAPGILGMTVLFTSIFSGMSVMFDKEFGFLKEILVAPVSRTSIVIGKALGGTTQASIQALLILVAFHVHRGENIGHARTCRRLGAHTRHSVLSRHGFCGAGD